jgi:hypothetical protein
MAADTPAATSLAARMAPAWPLRGCSQHRAGGSGRLDHIERALGWRVGRAVIGKQLDTDTRSPYTRDAITSSEASEMPRCALCRWTLLVFLAASLRAARQLSFAEAS